MADTSVNPGRLSGNTGSQQYLQFILNGENYAFDVLKTKEVLSYTRITPLPGSIEAFAGVINLRGSIIPIMDLRQRLGLSGSGSVETAYIIVLEIGMKTELYIVGALVDSVRNVCRFDASELEQPPPFGMRIDTHYVQAIAKSQQAFVTIINPDALFSKETLEMTTGTPSSPTE